MGYSGQFLFSLHMFLHRMNPLRPIRETGPDVVYETILTRLKQFLLSC